MKKPVLLLTLVLLGIYAKPRLRPPLATVKPRPGVTADDAVCFEIVREIIRHEDGLINHRVTWFLVIKGFLLTAFVSGVGLLEKFSAHLAHLYIAIGLSCIAGLGLACCFLVRVVTDQAYDQISAIAMWWDDPSKNPTEIHDRLPPIRGKGHRTNIERVFGTHSMPFFIGAVWIALCCLVWLAMATVI